MNLGWPTVLHVEDNLGDKELFQHASQSAELKWNLVWLEDGQTAIDYLCGATPYSEREKFPLPALVLLDLKMPRKNGFEVLHWLRQAPEFKALPVVIFTASNSNKDIRHAFQLGANSVVVKPTAYRDLQDYAKVLHHYWFRVNQMPGP